MNNTIATQVRELQHLAADQLAERYTALFGKPPRIRNVAWLRRQVAWKLQERELGGLSERASARLDELIHGLDVRLGTPPPPPPKQAAQAAARGPMVGTTIVKRWRDQDLRVDVREGGFEWNGVLYKSLSGVAKAITGTGWNGKLFFGLTQRRAGE